MKFKIHFTIDEYEDYFVIEGDTIKEIRTKSDSELKKRGLTLEKNNVYSIEVT